MAKYDDKQLIITLVVLLLILANIYNLLNILFQQDKPTIFSKLGSKIVTVIISCLKITYYTSCGLLDFWSKKYYNYDLYYNFMRSLIRIFIKKEYFITNTLILLGMRYLPKIILTLALFVDVIIYQRFHYTFKCIPLLLLPLVEKFIIGIFQDAYDSYIEELVPYVKFTSIPNTDDMACSYSDEYVENQPPNVKDFADFFYNHYLPLRKLKSTLDDYQFFCDITKSIPLDLAIAISRLFIYLYILNYGLN